MAKTETEDEGHYEVHYVYKLFGLQYCEQIFGGNSMHFGLFRNGKCTMNIPCFTGLDAGLPGGDLGLVLVVSASAAATSVLMLG